MSIYIHQINDRQILVNEKLVEKDMDGTWKERIELTTSERKQTFQFISSLEDVTEAKSRSHG